MDPLIFIDSDLTQGDATSISLAQTIRQLIEMDLEINAVNIYTASKDHMQVGKYMEITNKVDA